MKMIHFRFPAPLFHFELPGGDDGQNVQVILTYCAEKMQLSESGITSYQNNSICMITRFNLLIC